MSQHHVIEEALASANAGPNMLVEVEKRYKAAFRGVTPADKEEFKKSKVIVPISVGQKYHEAGEFEATMKLIDKSFKECIILVADTLKRYSIDILKQTRNEEEATLLAKQKGDQWLDRNMKYIDALYIPHKVCRWDEWMAHSEYPVYYNSVHQLYDNNQEYKDSVREVVEQFVFRKEGSHDSAWLVPSITYFLEESIGVCLYIKAGFKFTVYPNSVNKAIVKMYEQLLKEEGYEYKSLTLNLHKLRTV